MVAGCGGRGITVHHLLPSQPGLGLLSAAPPTLPPFTSTGWAHLCPDHPQPPLGALPEAVVGPGQAPQHPVVPQHQHPGRVQPGDPRQQPPIPAGPASPLVQPRGPIPAAGHQDVRGPDPLLDAPFALQPGSLHLGAARCGRLVGPPRKVPLDAAVGGQHGGPGQLPVWQEALQIQGFQVCTEAQLGSRAQEENQFLPWDAETKGTIRAENGREAGGAPPWQGRWFRVSHTRLAEQKPHEMLREGTGVLWPTETKNPTHSCQSKHLKGSEKSCSLMQCLLTLEPSSPHLLISILHSPAAP